jgi:hypothetical protein
VLGTSAPLWTLLLAAVDGLGLSTTEAARLLGAAAYTASVTLAAALAHRMAGTLAGVGAAALLVLPAGYRNLALSGMESGLAAALGLGAVLAVASRRPLLGGVLAGLAVVNKLDAAVLLGALLVVTFVVDRVQVRRVAGAAVLTTLPWFAFSWLWFGTLVPRSLTTKLSDSPDVSPTWALDALSERHLVALVVVAAVLPFVRWRTWTDRQRLVGGACALWMVGHLLAISVVDLGYAWPWYLTVLMPPAAVLGAAAVVEAMAAVAARSAGLRVAGLLLVAFAFAFAVTEQAGDTAAALVGRDTAGGSALIEEDLLAAADLINARGADTEVVESCLGTIQFGTLDHPQVDFCGLSTDREPGPTTWYVRAYYEPGKADPPPGDGFRAVADFTSSCARGLDPLWVRVYVREDAASAEAAPTPSGPVPDGCARP